MENLQGKLKRILAWIGIVLLVLMYLSTLVLALIGTEWASELLLVDIAATIIIPVLIYFIMMGIRLSQENRRKLDDEIKKISDENNSGK